MADAQQEQVRPFRESTPAPGVSPATRITSSQGEIPDEVTRQGNRASADHVQAQLAAPEAAPQANPDATATDTQAQAGNQGALATGGAPAFQIPRGVRNEHAFDIVVREVMERVPEAQRAYAQEAVPQILRQAADLNVRNPDQVAYLLATAQHETRFGQPNPRMPWSESRIEDRNGFSQTQDGRWTARVHAGRGGRVTADDPQQLEVDYWDRAYGGRLGNQPGTTDGRDFRGRGYTQLTGRDNYARQSHRMNNQGFSYNLDGQTFGGAGNPGVDLVANPDHVNRSPTVAARTLVDGMQSGTFTGAPMSRYLNDNRRDFAGARAVVNGDVTENGPVVAGYARRIRSGVDQHGSWNDIFYPHRPNFGGPR